MLRGRRRSSTKAERGAAERGASRIVGGLITRRVQLADFAAAAMLLRQSLAMAQSQKLTIDLQLEGSWLNLRLPGLGGDLTENHLSLACAIESLAMDVERETKHGK